MQAHPFIISHNLHEVCWAILIPDYEYKLRQCPRMTFHGIIRQHLQLHIRFLLLQQTTHDCMRKFMETSQHFM
jgi:hypothetical protein